MVKARARANPPRCAGKLELMSRCQPPSSLEPKRWGAVIDVHVLDHGLGTLTR
jgi:hypothetical protein